MTHIAVGLIICTFLLLGAAQLDDTCLLQADKKIHTVLGDSCECLHWSEAYHSRGAKCGQGHELAFVSLPGPKAAQLGQLKSEFCEKYFNNLPKDNFCMKANFQGDEDKHWCYVDPSCASGAKSQGDGPLKTKFCSRGQDKILGDMKFEELTALQMRSKLELGLMLQYAYPIFQGAKFPDVMPFWHLDEVKPLSFEEKRLDQAKHLQLYQANARPLGKELQQRIQQVIDSKKTMFVTSVSGHPPYGVIEGEKLYYVNFNPQYLSTVKDEDGMWNHKEEMNTWACLVGCPEGQAQSMWEMPEMPSE